MSLQSFGPCGPTSDVVHIVITVMQAVTFVLVAYLTKHRNGNGQKNGHRNQKETD